MFSTLKLYLHGNWWPCSRTRLWIFIIWKKWYLNLLDLSDLPEIIVTSNAKYNWKIFVIFHHSSHLDLCIHLTWTYIGSFINFDLSLRVVWLTIFSAGIEYFYKINNHANTCTVDVASKNYRKERWLVQTIGMIQ